jgi:hypothetical protein
MYQESQRGGINSACGQDQIRLRRKKWSRGLVQSNIISCSTGAEAGAIDRVHNGAGQIDTAASRFPLRRRRGGEGAKGAKGKGEPTM